MAKNPIPEKRAVRENSKEPIGNGSTVSRRLFIGSVLACFGISTIKSDIAYKHKVKILVDETKLFMGNYEYLQSKAYSTFIIGGPIQYPADAIKTMKGQRWKL